jgi:signal transduction histidine kinase
MGGRSRNALIASVLAFVALLAMAVLTYFNLRRLEEANRSIAHTYEVLNRLGDIMFYVSDAEGAMRGYAITGQKPFLAPYQEASATLPSMVDDLERLVSDNPGQRELARKLVDQVDRRLALLRRNVEARDSQGFEGVEPLIARGDGRRMTLEIRETLDALEAEEQRLLIARSEQAHSSFVAAVAMTIASAVLGMVLCGMGYGLVLRDIDARAKNEQALSLANAQLEAKVQARTASIQEMNRSLQDEVEERRRAEETARAAATELQRSNRELEQFASVASHDLQEPLRKIQAFGDRLHAQFRSELADKGKDYLDRMLASAGRMRTLIDDLLSFSRVSSKAQPFVPCDLNTIAQEVVSDLEGRIEQKSGNVEVGPLPTIDADPLQMRQLLQNLIVNGLKFQRPDAPPRVTVVAELLPPIDGEGARCKILIRDNGIGFEQTYASRIFELFQRLHGRNEYEGTGIGLAICRKIVERHGGTIEARSQPGDGAEFSVTLPVSHSNGATP